MTSDERDRVYKIVFTVAVTTGVMLRVWHWIYERSLWIDEARLALNVLGRPFGDLGDPLWFDQSAPYLFLVSVKALSVALGPSESTLRLIPQIAGILTLPLTYSIARPVVSPISALIATAVVSFSPYLIYYSNELKPYSSDLFVSILLVGLVGACINLRDRGHCRRLLWAGMVSPWVTSAAFFVLPGCLLAVLIKRAWTIRSAITVGLLWVTSAAVAWTVIYLPAAHNSYLDDFWRERFWSVSPGWWGRVWNSLNEVVGGHVVGRILAPGEPSVWVGAATVATIVLMIIGIVRLWRMHASSAILMASPIALVMLAALIGAYPFALRVTLFIGPLVIILVCAGLDGLFGGHRAPIGGVGYLAVTVMIVLPLLLRSLSEASLPERWAPIREVVRSVMTQAGGEDRYYIGAGAVPTWIYYTTNWADPDSRRVARTASAASAGGYAFENGPYLRGLCATATDVATDTREILGCSTGMEWVWGKGFSRGAPDPAWAAVEAGRIARNACPAIWVVLAHAFGNDDLLHRAIRSSGVRKVHETGDRRALATKYTRC